MDNIDGSTADKIYKMGYKDAIRECIDRLVEYKEQPLTDPYVIEECIIVLQNINSKEV